MAQQKLTERVKASSSSNSDIIHIVKNGVSYYIEKGDFIGTRVDNLEANQVDGVARYDAVADLPATGVATTSYKVTADPTASNNGFYSWNGSAYVKDASLFTGEVVAGETEAVSGDTVYAHLGSKPFLDRYVKPNDLVNNPAYAIYDLIDEIDWGINTNTTNPISKSTIDLPSDFALPFKRAVNLKTTAPFPGSSNNRLNISWKQEYKENLIISSWCEVEYGLNKNIGYYIYFKRGYNDALIASYNAQETITVSQYNTIKTAIDTTGYWEEVATGFTKRSYGYYEYGGRYWLHYEIEITATVGESDYVDIYYGTYNAYASGDEKDLWYFGFQVFQNARLDQFAGEPEELGIGEKGVFDYKQNNAYAESYDYDNQINDFLNGGRKVLDLGDNDFSVSTANIFEFKTTDYLITETGFDNVYQKWFKIDYNSGSNFPKWSSAGDCIFKYILDETFTTSTEKDNATFGFWINRTELNGNGLTCEISGAQWFLKPSDLISKGFKESRFGAGTNQGDIFEIKEVYGDYTFIIANVFNLTNGSTREFRLDIYNTSSNNVTSLTIYNPTLIYHKSIDPYYNYKSKAEKNKSKWIGSNFLYIGDSQYNDQILPVDLAIEYGCNVIDAHYGGYSMKINSANLGQTNYNSFYHRDLRDAVIDLDNIDLYIFTVSTNDGDGGGDLSTTAVQYVLDNYPAYGDDAGTVTTKQALFDALSTSEVDTNFDYKNCYSAYLKQLQENRPDARIIVCSIPISLSGYLTGATDGNGHGIWQTGKDADTAYNEQNTNRQAIRDDSKAIADKHNCNWVDLLNDSGLTYWNFTAHCIDGTHWDNWVDQNITNRIIEEINKI